MALKILYRFGRRVTLEALASISLAVSLLPVQGQQIPFVLPWNDSTATVTDFSSYNPVISTQRVAIDTEGHFVADGKRIRFLGVNFAGDSPFMPTNKADAVAARLAKYGVNNVRFHHMDASWASGGGLLAYNSTSSTNINPSQLERLHFLVSRLGAHGVYANINLLVGREYRPGDGLGPEVAAMDWKDSHVLGYFYPPALKLQQDYATKLLTSTNRFTGLSLAQDPAVSFVEIINENGIIQKWLDGGLDRLPSRYSTNLQAAWNQWLVNRYTNDANLTAGWKLLNEPLGTNLLRNGAFSNALTSWSMEQHETARAGFARTFDFINGQPSARIMVTNPDSVSWHIQFNQRDLRLYSTQVCTLSFWAKSDPATNFDVSVMRAHSDYAALGYSQSLALTTNWQQFTVSFMPTVSETNARVNFGGMGNKRATFWVADVSLRTGGQLGSLPEGTSLATRTVPNILHSGAGYIGTREARRDWLALLRKLENDYYDQMLHHVRHVCGYPGLVFGTIMANSPATVQSRLDVIDGHAYWNHPEFPGAAWDSKNWLVRNTSMVTTLDNTLSGLMRQRIKGKPFTVTEYQHPSPNYYGAEGPLLLAAYGALQDWDGLWMFDYGPGQDSVTMGYVRGFFEIGQHPTKMANLLLAANIFRRGDVRAAAGEQTLTLGPGQELDLLLKAGAWGVFSGSQLGMPSKMGFTRRVSTSVLTNDPGPATPPSGPTGNLLTSDTGQLVWNVSQSGRELVTINSPRTRALIGYADEQTVNLGGITLRPGSTMLDWCTLGMTVKRGEVMTNDCTLLVVATGWWENTGQVWKDSSKQSVGNQWGHAPVLTEAVPFTLTLPVPTNHVRAWELDARGTRTRELSISGDSTKTVLQVGTNSPTIWYEVEIGRWVASFDLWRARYFSGAELAQPGVSGPSAVPDGDNVPNLAKYLFGLPGKAPAPRERLPRGILTSVQGETYLAMEYWRDKLVQDVAAEPQATSALSNWQACCTTEEVADDGTLERVLVHDNQPVDTAPSRFLRLQLSTASHGK